MNDPDAEIILEMNRIGGAVEVRAISAGDGLEVSFTAPASAAQSDLHRLARQKLAYVRARAEKGGQGGKDKPPSGGGRGGIVA
ncbi:MAG TPA: hypothetical protein VGO52_04370 [Hyphomonadaceae bacterium]|jgi:hypothetical protein|nr:hypothetical protein [Hyphomonadaceae bacterium]